MSHSAISLPSIDSRFRAAAHLLDGYVHESRFLRRDQSPDHEILWASDGFEAIFGCTVEQYNRRGLWGGIYLPEDAKAAVLRAARLRRGETVEGELRMMRENKEIRWMYVKNRPIFDPITSEVIGVLGVGQDITRRKLAERENRRSESILISVARSDPDWLLLLNSHLEVQFYNHPHPAAAPHVYIGAPLFSLLQPQDHERVLTDLRAILAGAAPLVVGVPFRWAGDVGRHLEMRAAPVHEHGNITGLAVRIGDITERQRNEEVLRTQSIVLENIDEGVIVFDRAGRISFANGAGRRMFGMRLTSVDPVNISQLGIPFDSTAELPPLTSEAVCLRTDGTQFLARLEFARLELRGLPMIVVVVQDYTEQRQLEREIIEIANREQQKIAVELHDGLGQELTGAALTLRSLADKTKSVFSDTAEPMQELIELINRAIQRVRTLAHCLAPVDLERGDLGAALSSLVARTRENHSINMKFRCRPAQVPALPADVANHLYRIAQEAIFNAMRRSGTSNLSISLTLGRNNLVLKIGDDGQGISYADAPQSGMGLRIIQYRARMIGAQVSVEPRATGGTTVLCRRPKG